MSTTTEKCAGISEYVEGSENIETKIALSESSHDVSTSIAQTLCSIYTHDGQVHIEHIDQDESTAKSIPMCSKKWRAARAISQPPTLTIQSNEQAEAQNTRVSSCDPDLKTDSSAAVPKTISSDIPARPFKHPSSKRQQLTAEDAAKIYIQRPKVKAGKCLRRGSMIRCKVIAPKFGVSPKTIRDIWRARTWIHATQHLWTDEERAQRKDVDSDSDKEIFEVDTEMASVSKSEMESRSSSKISCGSQVKETLHATAKTNKNGMTVSSVSEAQEMPMNLNSPADVAENFTQNATSAGTERLQHIQDCNQSALTMESTSLRTASLPTVGPLKVHQSKTPEIHVANMVSAFQSCATRNTSLAELASIALAGIAAPPVESEGSVSGLLLSQTFTRRKITEASEAYQVHKNTTASSVSVAANGDDTYDFETGEVGAVSSQSWRQITGPVAQGIGRGFEGTVDAEDLFRAENQRVSSMIQTTDQLSVHSQRHLIQLQGQPQHPLQLQAFQQPLLSIVQREQQRIQEQERSLRQQIQIQLDHQLQRQCHLNQQQQQQQQQRSILALAQQHSLEQHQLKSSSPNMTQTATSLQVDCRPMQLGVHHHQQQQLQQQQQQRHRQMQMKMHESREQQIQNLDNSNNMLIWPLPESLKRSAVNVCNSGSTVEYSDLQSQLPTNLQRIPIQGNALQTPRVVLPGLLNSSAMSLQSSSSSWQAKTAALCTVGMITAPVMNHSRPQHCMQIQQQIQEQHLKQQQLQQIQLQQQQIQQQLQQQQLQQQQLLQHQLQQQQLQQQQVLLQNQLFIKQQQP